MSVPSAARPTGKTVLTPIESSATYDRVADQLRRSIHLGEYLPGDRLPAERQLAELLGVSRVTVREAIRVLEGQGYIRVVARRGPHSGAVVLRSPESPEVVRARLAEDLPQVNDLYDFRLATEPVAARLAAERRTEDDLAAMQTALRDMAQAGSVAAVRRADSAFHMAVASASGSPRLRAAIEDANAAMYQAASVFDYVLGDPTLIRGHERLYRAIELQDGARAQRIAAEHVEVARQELLEILRAAPADAFSSEVRT